MRAPATPGAAVASATWCALHCPLRTRRIHEESAGSPKPDEYGLTLTTLVAIALAAVLPIYPDLVSTARPADFATYGTPDASPTDASPAGTGAAAVKAEAPPLDLTGLEQRLRNTSAIGIFTKLALKNQVDDLLEQFKAFHEGRGQATLEDLREHYNLLLLKVLSL